MDDEPQAPQPDPKISDVEIILLGIIFIISDFFELIPLAGDFLDIIVGAPFDLYIFLKGLNGTVAFIDQIIELIPALQELPLWTFSWVVIVWLDRHPKIETALATVETFTGGLGEGNIEEVNGGGIERRIEKGGGAEGGGIEDAVSEGNDRHLVEGKPSDVSTERNIAENLSEDEREARRDGSVAPEFGSDAVAPTPLTEEEQRQEAENKRYAEITTAEAEKNPVDVARESELGSEVPVKSSAAEKDEADQPDLTPENQMASSRLAKIREQQKADEVRRDFQKPKPAKQAVVEEIGKSDAARRLEERLARQQAKQDSNYLDENAA